MNILFLDDSNFRHQRFRELGLCVKHVKTAVQCVNALGKGPWGLVFLDHDLEGEPYADPDGRNTGSEVVRHVVDGQPQVKRFIIHSYNHKEGPKMAEALKAAGYEAEWSPFNPTQWELDGVFR